MNNLTTVTTKGQVTIPEIVRQSLGIKVGDKVSFTKMMPTYKEILIKIIPSSIVKEFSGSLSSKIKVSNHKKVRRELKKFMAKKYKIR